MKLMDLTLGVALPGVFAVTGLAQWRESAHLPTTVETTLTEVRAHPEAFRNVKVKFDVQFATLGGVANPFFTPFSPADYANFHAWGAEQPIWRRADFEDMFGLLFLAKTSDQLQALYDAKTFNRLRVTALVRNTFQGRPWIEVLAFEPLPEKVDWPTLGHVYRAEEWMAKRQWRRALNELSLAAQAANPREVTAQVAKATGTCYLRLGEAQPALQHLTRAHDLLGKDADFDLESLLVVARKDPGRELDRTVVSDGLNEFERPLWEAFDEANQRRPALDSTQPAQPTPENKPQPAPTGNPEPPQPQK